MPRPSAEPMTVIGAGSWGTALAIQLAREGHPTQLWGRDGAQLDAMRRARRNVRYLPDAGFPVALQIADDLRRALESARDALIAVPSDETPRIQECHILIGHALCDAVEHAIATSQANSGFHATIKS